MESRAIRELCALLLPSEIIDVDEIGEQALRALYNSDVKIERKPSTQEQGMGDEFA